MKNILTFDIEEWFHANFGLDFSSYSCKETNFRTNMDKILMLCSKYNCKATFFILGYIGENYPDVVKAIADLGHDVATHGYGHELAYSQSSEEFKEDVKKSLGILESITGKKVLGYRAPSWSIIEKNISYLEILESLGLKYDASIFPVKTFLYGIPEAPRNVHKPIVNGKELGIYEIPTSVFDFLGKGVGYSGGFYFRFFPGIFIKNRIRYTNKIGLPAVVYLHPREIDPYERKLELPLKESFIQYYNVHNTYEKLENILKDFDFISIRDYLVEEKGVCFS